MAKYHELMQRVELTDEMRSRILRNVEMHALREGKSGRRVPVMAAAAAAAIVLLLGVRGIYPLITATDEPQESVGADFYYEQEFASAKELSDAVGFAVPELTTVPFEVQEIRFSCICGDLAQIEYVGTKDQMTFRKSEGTQDNSGNYEVYPTEKNVQAGNQTVTLKGKDGLVFLALWTADGYTCSISDANGLTEAEVLGMIAEIMEEPGTGK